MPRAASSRPAIPRTRRENSRNHVRGGLDDRHPDTGGALAAQPFERERHFDSGSAAAHDRNFDSVGGAGREQLLGASPQGGRAVHRSHGERVLAYARRLEARRLGADVERQQVVGEPFAGDLDPPRCSVDPVRLRCDESRAGARREGAQVEGEIGLGVDPLQVARHHSRIEVAFVRRNQRQFELPRRGERRPRRLGEQVNVSVSTAEEDQSAGCLRARHHCCIVRPGGHPSHGRPALRLLRPPWVRKAK